MVKIIKIGAIWCPGCLVMGKTWNNIIRDYDNLDILELDYDMDSQIVSEYNPGRVLPVIIFMSNDNLDLERLIGEQKEETIRKKIDKYKVK